MKHETKLKGKQNKALYNPRDLNDAYQLKCLTRELTLVMHKQHSTAIVNLVTLHFQLTLLDSYYFVSNGLRNALRNGLRNALRNALLLIVE